MKIPISIYIALLLLCFLNVKSQNLVPDTSFEDIRRLPKKKDNSVSCTKNWQCPMDYGAGDYYHKNGKGHGRAPHNIFGRQKPHSGNAYGGICVRKKFKEYLETKLTDTLIQDQEYLVEFYISRAERSLGSVKEFGVLFSDKISMGISGNGIPRKPSIEIVKKNGFRKKKKWMKFSAVYQAKGGETVLILGYFNHSGVKNFKGNAHYYIDDVTVIPINSKEISKENPQEIAPVETKHLKTNLPKLGETITIKNISFNTNKSELLPSSFSALDQLVEHLNLLSNASIEISGHTDNTGDEDQNQLLSEQRAKAVAYYLISKGIQPTRINFTGYGSSKPLENNTTEEGKQTNRRVEFILKNK